MLMLPPSVGIWMSTSATDMRRSFDGLAQLVREHMGENPLSGHLFVFRNRRGDRVKILWWDRDGYVLWYKRLEMGTFCMAEVSGAERSVTITASQLSWILDGIDLKSVRRKQRYSVVS